MGGDEDAVTLAVAAGRAAIEASDGAPVARVVLVTRDLPLLDGGNGAPLARRPRPARPRLEVRETVGGAPAVLDAVVTAGDGTLVIGADTGRRDDVSAGGQRCRCRQRGASITSLGRVTRSMPTPPATGRTATAPTTPTRGCCASVA